MTSGHDRSWTDPAMRGRGGGADSRTILQATLLCAVFLGGIWLSRQYDLNVSVEPVARAAAASADAYVPDWTRTEGPHLVLLFAGSSSCRWSTDPELPDAVESLKLQLAQYAGERAMAFRAIGVSVDWDTARGLEHLATFGRFDEVATGGNWANSALLDHVWERGYTMATPGVFVYLREVGVEADRESDALASMRRARDELLLVRTGLDEIQQLVELGPERFLPGLANTSPGAGGASQGRRLLTGSLPLRPLPSPASEGTQEGAMVDRRSR